MPHVRLKATSEAGRAVGWLDGEYPASARTEVRTWLTPDKTLVVQLWWHVYTAGEGGVIAGEAVLHLAESGCWHGTVPELLGKWAVLGRKGTGVLFFADNEDEARRMMVAADGGGRHD